jgi:DNA-binding Xre family transcriptional regulator
MDKGKLLQLAKKHKINTHKGMKVEELARLVGLAEEAVSKS